MIEYLFEFSQLVTIFVDFTKSKSPSSLNDLVQIVNISKLNNVRGH